MALPPLSTVPLMGINPSYSITAKGDKPDPNLIIQFNTIVQTLTQQINAIVVAFNAAQAAQTTADGAQSTADGAQTGVDQLAADQYVIAAASPDLPNARVLTDTATVTKDIATAGQIKILVDALAILNGAMVALTQPVTAGAGLKVTGLTETDSLRIDTAATVAAVVQTAYVPVNINGTVYKLLLG